MTGLSINQMTTFRRSFEEDLERYRAAGISAIGVWRRKLSDYGEQRGVALIRQSGLAVSNLLWAGGFTGSDGRSYHESIADAREAIRLAHALSAGCLVVYSGGRNRHTQKHVRRLFAGALRELLPLAEELGVVLAVEPMHPGCAEDWTFITTLDEAVSLVRGLNSPHLKLVFDTYHLGFDPRIVEQIPHVAEHIAIVHLADGRQPPEHEQNRYSLGEGTLPLDAIVQSLKQSGYQGYYDVELIGEAVENQSYCDLLRHSKCVYERLMA
jgi:sugar phosphate isomerase/epimerase